MMMTTRIIDTVGGVSLTLGYVYMVGGWRAWLHVINQPMGAMTRQLAVGPQPRWARGLFWLGVGLFALGLWRQWSGV